MIAADYMIVGSGLTGATIARALAFTPTDPADYEYPFPDAANRALYTRYRERADQIGNILVCGRLGEFRYFDMDQAIGRALSLAGRILGEADAAGSPIMSSAPGAGWGAG